MIVVGFVITLTCVVQLHGFQFIYEDMRKYFLRGLYVLTYNLILPIHVVRRPSDARPKLVVMAGPGSPMWHLYGEYVSCAMMNYPALTLTLRS